ncbi:HelD family protein [Sporomusa acidovorans]|uniref:DNA helicase IV n=1 Tax=Sporomusa acidovorans (strain ATCC 49682 / DSM 3132 / Mol) TaxID=1123286 RepID=A0ABZ3J8B6_SPOA4|nr:UvrD-helicase domain-containing protein [Sporomusa acidovorans]OZC16632.1 helicase IV [Sporomusa acidovorans DSM 3132]SDE07662.1 DNA helicase-2 / ATP-dependent DNA helicase PcrA [Sporomusa acidovorans]
MSNHPDFPWEQQHLAETIQAMKQIINDLENDMEDRVHKINQSLSKKDEVSAYVHSLMKSDHAVKAADIAKAMDTPYFGRVDFREDGAEDFDQYYIGRTKVAKLDIESVKDILVFDWRDPVSTIFYECQDGRASYEVLDRYTYTGDVRLKRQYKIEDGSLLSMSEDNLLSKIMSRQQESLIADPFLLERLLTGAGDKLKDIVTSIRAEQNQIIREPLNQVTIIQGVAGSGKSTIGLHRLSYLLYNEKLNPAKLVIVAPNKIFLDYISELLPEIDAQDVRQTTFADLAATIMQIEPVISRTATPTATQAALAKWKGTPELIKVMEAFLDKKLEKFCVQLKEIRLFDDQLIITREQQLAKVLEGATVPYNERLGSLQKYIRFRVKNFIEVYETKTRRGQARADEKTAARYAAEGEKFIAQQFAKWPVLDLLTGYKELFRDKQAWRKVKPHGVPVEALLSHTLALLATGHIERDDLAPLCYLKYLLDGFAHVEKFDHIAVDEGQDSNLLEYIILSRLSRNSSFTIMGDMSQAIHTDRGLASWQELLKEVFATAKCRYYEVNFSYRSAKEIVDLFNKVLPTGRSKAIPVYEIGRQPVIEQASSPLTALKRLPEVIEEYQNLGCKSIGLLTKLESDSQKLYESLQQTAPHLTSLNLITGNALNYQGGITVAPILLAKGLEFDGVIIWNASAKKFTADFHDAKLLYVALSRAMYYLHILYQGNLSPLLT